MGEDLTYPIKWQMKAVLPAQDVRANTEAPAKLFSIGHGAGACTIRAQRQHRFLGRMCRVTVNVTVFASSTSDSSALPSPSSSPPQSRARYLRRLDHVGDAFEVERVLATYGALLLRDAASSREGTPSPRRRCSLRSRARQLTAAFQFLQRQRQLATCLEGFQRIDRTSSDAASPAAVSGARPPGPARQPSA